MTEPKRHIERRRIYFGDCDPAQIVYYPRFHMMFDRATEAMFIERGIDWKKLHDEVPDFAGMPILEVKANYRIRVAFGDEIEIHSWVDEIKEKTFKVCHEIHKNGEVAATGYELRAVVMRDESKPQGARAIPLPDDLLEKLTG